MRLACCVLLIASVLSAQIKPAPFTDRNQAERLEWFRDAGLGLFIHWTVDNPLGVVISHSLPGASADYRERYFRDLPGHFDPQRFDAKAMARLARLAGFRYMMLTSKHHNGFCLWDTKTTPFNVMQTPVRRDLLREIVEAFRTEGIAPGFYFSPDDFLWLHRNGKVVDRYRPEVIPVNNPGLMELDKAQVRELLTNYGRIDLMFLDGPPEGLRELSWELQPQILVTRGAMETPEQTLPGVPMDKAWEACHTMGTEWNWKPTNETYKTGREILQLLIETRAKGGNLLLNVGPKPDGTLPIEQESLLRELALWMFTNGESIYGVRPWVLTNEGDVWFTRKKGENTVYAVITNRPQWKWGTRQEFVLRSVRATPRTEVSVLGHDGKTLEYRADIDPAPRLRQGSDGLHLDVMRAQRMYTDRSWPNPIVVKLTNVEAALTPPRVLTSDALIRGGDVMLRADVQALGGVDRVEVGFQVRPQKNVTELYEKDEPWVDVPVQPVTRTGPVTTVAPALTPGRTYEVRAVVKHPLVTLYGTETAFVAPRRPQ